MEGHQTAVQTAKAYHFFKNYQTLTFGSPVSPSWPTWQNGFTSGYLYLSVWAKFHPPKPNLKIKNSLFTIQSNSNSNHKSNLFEWSLSPLDQKIHLLYNGLPMANKAITSSISGTKLVEDKWFLTYVKRDRYS